MARVKNHLALKAMDDFLRDQNEFLELEVAKRTREVMAIHERDDTFVSAQNTTT